MAVEPCDPRRREVGAAWDDYVFGSSRASHSHLSGWLRVIERSYGHRPMCLWARDAGRIRGVLPLVSMRGTWRGRSLVSLPFLDDGGICADDEVATRELLEGACQLMS